MQPGPDHERMITPRRNCLHVDFSTNAQLNTHPLDCVALSISALPGPVLRNVNREPVRYRHLRFQICAYPHISLSILESRISSFWPRGLVLLTCQAISAIKDPES